LTNGWQSRASFAKGFRAPTLKELYLDFAHAGMNIIGNPNLEAESSYTFNASVDYTFRDADDLMFKAGLKGYYNNIYNKIDFAKVSDVGGIETWQNVNRGNIETLGWIADITLDLDSKWSFSTNFSRGGITSLEYENDKSKSQYVFTNNFLTSVMYKVRRYDFSTRVEYAFNGEEPARYIDEITSVEPMVESYHDLNLTMTKSFLKRRLNITAGVKNIFDNTDLQYIGASPTSGGNNIDSYRMLSWGRSYFVKLNFKLNKN
jgi:outer membrane receptor for ferrienterochelin and colicins